MTVTFRPARRDDIPAIVALLADDIRGAGREVVSDPPHPAYVAAWEAMAANPYDYIVVGEADGKIVACAQLTILLSLGSLGMRRGQIEGVRVASDRRGERIGEALIAHCVALAKAEGCGVVQLFTSTIRERARAFYKRLGFKETHVGMKLDLKILATADRS
jgi:ribosomal protein S18 acetylase RimI-like enzyme